MMGHQFYKRTSRGPHWTLEEFYNMYDLPSKKAHDLYYRFGPGSVDLAVLMAAGCCPVEDPRRYPPNHILRQHALRKFDRLRLGKIRRQQAC
jgi:hypothetical protein